MEATKHSTPPQIVGRIGDVDPVTHGGGVLLFTSQGPLLEYTEGTEAYDETEELLLDVYRILIEPNILTQFDLTQEEIIELCDSLEENEEKWTARCSSPNPTIRARCLVDIVLCATEWDEIDSNSLQLSETELRARWFSEARIQGAVTTPGCFKPEIVVPQLLKTLLTAFPDAYWKAQAHPFPLVPEHALVDTNNLWWRQHGSQALNKLVEILKPLAPAGFIFCIKEETFGFWKNHE